MSIDVMTRAMPFQVPTFPLQPAHDAPRLRFHTCILLTRRSAVKHAAVYPRARGLWSFRLWADQRLQFVEERCHVLQAAGDTAGTVPVFIEVDVKSAGQLEEAVDVIIAGLLGQDTDCIVEQLVSAVAASSLRAWASRR